MRERAEMLGGKLEIKADPGNGTTVKAAVPMT
jgi:signal transduction histidine kinase